VLQVLNWHQVTVRRSGLEPLPGCPEGILSPPSTFRNPTTYPVIQGRAALGLVRVSAFRDIRFCYRNRYQWRLSARSTWNAANCLPQPSVLHPGAAVGGE
jgi:hypothetical protein